MAGELDAYADARNAFEAAKGTLTTMAERMAAVARALESAPPDLGFTNLGAAYPMSARISNFMDANHWPTAVQIMDAVNRCHTAYSALRTAYSNIPHDRRGLVDSPDSLTDRPTGSIRPTSF